MLHGPEIIDSGSAQLLISYLQKHGPVKAVLGGTRMMSRSIIFRVTPENDDMAGELVQARIFEAGERVIQPGRSWQRGSGKLPAAAS